MIDWQVSEGEAPLEEAPSDPTESPRRRSLRTYLLTLLLLVGATSGAIWWRLEEREAVARSDLTERVTEEERVRRFGLKQEAAAFILPDSPRAWQAAYFATVARSSDLQPADVSIKQLALDAAGALVTVEIGTEERVRYYRLRDDQWYRSPIPTEQWGAVEVAPVPEGPRVAYRTRDRAFARDLAEGLPSLMERFELWPGRAIVHGIEIEPVEFAPPLVESSGPRIVLNSPLLSPQGGPLSASSQVRLALGEAIANRVGPVLEETRLPGATPFLEATRAITAMEWAVTASEGTAIRNLWMERLGPEWISPFFLSFQSRDFDVLSPGPAEAAMLLTVDAIARRWGNETVAAIVARLPEAASWDEVLYGATGFYTYQIEALVAGAGVEASTGAASAEAALPLVGSVSPDSAALPGFLRLQAEGAAKEVIVQSRGAEVVLQGGYSLPAECAGLFRTMVVEGEWVEQELRLRARSIAVPEMVPAFLPDTEAPPAGTLGFVLAQEPAAGQVSKPHTLYSLVESGAGVELREQLSLEPFSALWRVDSPDGRLRQLLMEWGIPGCPQSWLFLYDPLFGIADRWLLAAEFGRGTLRAYWREEEDDILLYRLYQFGDSGTGAWRVGTLGRNAVGVVEPERSLDSTLTPLGWRAPGYLVSYPLAGVERIVLLPREPGIVFPIADIPDEGPIVSDMLFDGRNLYYMTPRRFDEVTGVDVKVLDTLAGLNRTLTWVTRDAIVYLGAPGEATAHFLYDSGPAGTREGPLTQVIIANPTRLQDVTRAVNLSEGEEITSIVVCPDGSFLYSVRGESRQIRHWDIERGETTLLPDSESELRVWACG